MKLLMGIVGAGLWAVLTGAVVYGKNRRRRLGRVLTGLDRAGIERISQATQTALRNRYSEFSLSGFNEAVALLEKEFRPSNENFLSALPRGEFPKGFADYWVVDMGILLGDLVRQHSQSVSEWAQDGAGNWRLKFNLSSQDFYWDPVKAAEDRFTGKTADLLLALKLVQTLK